MRDRAWRGGESNLQPQYPDRSERPSFGELGRIDQVLLLDVLLAVSRNVVPLHQRFAEQFDLMIKGKGLDELRKYRLELVSRGIAVGEIPDETFFGHHLFCIKDPDGNGITIYTSHAIH